MYLYIFTWINNVMVIKYDNNVWLHFFFIVKEREWELGVVVKKSSGYEYTFYRVPVPICIMLETCTKNTKHEQYLWFVYVNCTTTKRSMSSRRRRALPSHSHTYIYTYTYINFGNKHILSGDSCGIYCNIQKQRKKN